MQVQNTYCRLKGIVSQDFDHHFFHDSNPSGLVFHMLKYFCRWFQFCGDIHGVIDTAESNSMVSLTPRSFLTLYEGQSVNKKYMGEHTVAILELQK